MSPPSSTNNNESSRYITGVGNPLHTDPKEVSAIRAPLMYADNWLTIAGGAVAIVFAWLVVPAFMLLAFVAELAEADMTDRSTSVKFLHFTHTVRDGTRAAITSSLVIIPVFLIWTLFGGVTALIESTSGLTMFSSAFYILSSVGAILVTFLAMYMFPAIFVESVRSNSASSALSMRLFRIARSRHYFLSWWMALITVTGGHTMAFILLFIPPVGFLLGPIVFFYSICVAIVFISRAINDSPEDFDKPSHTNRNLTTSLDGEPMSEYPSIDDLRNS